jgi:hypothetical protein
MLGYFRLDLSKLGLVWQSFSINVDYDHCALTRGSC